MGHGQPPRPRTVPRLNNKTGLIGMDDRPVALAERGARARKHAVGQLGVGARADRPGDGKPVVAVDQGRQVRLARRDMLNSVRSVTHSMFGPSAWKSRLARFSGALVSSPLYEL